METMKDGRLRWTVHTRIDKFNTRESYQRYLDSGRTMAPDEVTETCGNMLLNDGVNLLWSLVAGMTGNLASGLAIKPFNHANSYIGVGDNDGGSLQPEADDTGLRAYTTSKKYMYMKMDDDYPIAGENQKIVFRSTYLPGVACFDWYEWTIANGNGNQTTGIDDDTAPGGDDRVRKVAKGDDPIPDPVPLKGTAYEDGDGQENVTCLNHKQENMGRKYSSATWIVTCEISLS